METLGWSLVAQKMSKISGRSWTWICTQFFSEYTLRGTHCSLGDCYVPYLMSHDNSSFRGAHVLNSTRCTHTANEPSPRPHIVRTRVSDERKEAQMMDGRIIYSYYQLSPNHDSVKQITHSSYPSSASQPLIITILLFYVFSMSTSQENCMLKNCSPVCWQ